MIIDLQSSQLSKLIYTASLAQKEERKHSVRQKLMASLRDPVKARQKMSFIFETTRGIFRVESKPVGLTERYATVKGGHVIPLESILKVI
jgi:hypothetical protein